MVLRVTNVLHRQKEDFAPLREGRVNLYVCGPTVYDHAHLGHAKTYVAFDLIVRYLRYRGYDVLYVQNLTDVGHLLDGGEDRILRKARQAAAQPMQVVETYARSYFADMDALGVVRPDISPRASGHIPEQLAMIRALIEKGHAYVADGNVYFDVRSFPGYGKLSNRKLDEQLAESRGLGGEGKRHPADFALWKRADPQHMLRWDSPWGEGYPGWHIECSAMACKYLGDSFDIHGGGIDNIFPHNECEIAQSEAATGQPFARYWILVGSLTVDGRKMSKSLGNFRTIKDALTSYRPEVVRTFVFSGHYSNPIDYSEAALEAAGKGWERLMSGVRLNRQKLDQTAADSPDDNTFAAALDDHKRRFLEALDDDFNAPGALALLQSLTREVNTLLNSQTAVGQPTLTAIDDLYCKLGGRVLGVIPDQEPAASAGRGAELVQLLIDLRAQVRAEKNWALADTIRDRLAGLGITLEDRPDGTIWHVT